MLAICVLLCHLLHQINSLQAIIFTGCNIMIIILIYSIWWFYYYYYIYSYFTKLHNKTEYITISSFNNALYNINYRVIFLVAWFWKSLAMVIEYLFWMLRFQPYDIWNLLNFKIYLIRLLGAQPNLSLWKCDLFNCTLFRM